MLQSAPFNAYKHHYMSLSSQQVRALRAEAHRLKLKPVVIIGNNGLSESVIEELRLALAHHELIKVRVPALQRADKKSLIEKMLQAVEAELIQTVGHVAVVYRLNPDRQRFVKLL
jgi:RNA-binding protein